ncbi:MAG: ABC transporter permease [Chloroflexi bacterium]|jgi:ribose transport system permease protein|nr:ABC transporter permease [Chloroflexota bacterium]
MQMSPGSRKTLLRQVPTVVWVLLGMILFFARFAPAFFTLKNAVNLLTQGSILMILCMGVIVVKITGGIELSVGAVMTLAGMVMAWALAYAKLPIPVALLLSLIVGGLCGLLNGFFVTKMDIPSFIATLGTQGIAAGISLGMNNGNVIWGLPASIGYLGNGTFLHLPVPMWLSVLAFLCSFTLLNFTPFGVYVYALGGNEQALVLTGKPAWWYKTLVYVYAGLMAGLAAIVITGRNMCAQPTVGLGMEFEAFSAVVLGGSFAAGRGTAIGTVIGVLFILILRNGLNVMGIPTYIQLAIIGPVLIGAIVLSVLVEGGAQK